MWTLLHVVVVILETMDCSGVVYLNIKQCFDYICFKKDMILDIDSVIPFSKRHGGETIREIIRYDSGYLKDLMLKDDRVVFSDTCFYEIKRLTKNHFDNWETPSDSGMSIFKKLKTYVSHICMILMMAS